MYLKIEPYADADLALAIGSGWDKKILTREFLRGGRFGAIVAKRLKIDELGPIAENRCVENVVEFNNGTEAHPLAEFPFARDAHIECKKTRAASGVAGEIAAFCADGLERKLRNKAV